MRGVFGVYVALGHVRTAASMLYMRAEVPLILRARTQTCALSLDTEVLMTDSNLCKRRALPSYIMALAGSQPRSASTRSDTGI